MAIAFRAAGTSAVASASGASSLVPTLPTGWQPGDIHLLGIQIGSNTVASGITDYGGFTLKIGRDDAGSVGVAVAWRRAQVGDTNPTIRVNALAADPTIAQIVGFSGAVSTGDPITATSGQTNAASTTVTCPAVTPLDANSMILLVLGANGNTSASGYSGTDPTFTEALDTASALNGGAMLAAAYGIRSVATSTGSRTATLANAVTSAAVMLALKPEPAGGVAARRLALLGVG